MLINSKDINLQGQWCSEWETICSSCDVNIYGTYGSRLGKKWETRWKEEREKQKTGWDGKKCTARRQMQECMVKRDLSIYLKPEWAAMAVKAANQLKCFSTAANAGHLSFHLCHLPLFFSSSHPNFTLISVRIDCISNKTWRVISQNSFTAVKKKKQQQKINKTKNFPHSKTWLDSDSEILQSLPTCSALWDDLSKDNLYILTWQRKNIKNIGKAGSWPISEFADRYKEKDTAWPSHSTCNHSSSFSSDGTELTCLWLIVSVPLLPPQVWLSNHSSILWEWVWGRNKPFWWGNSKHVIESKLKMKGLLQL